MRCGSYVLIKAPSDYPGRTYRGKLRYAYEHSVAWWQNTGQVVPNGWTVHHKNEDKHDNAFSNLELKTKSRHTADHNKRPKITLRCAWCSTTIERHRGNLSFRRKHGQTDFYCNRSCEAKHRWSRDGCFKAKNRINLGV